MKELCGYDATRSTEQASGGPVPSGCQGQESLGGAQGDPSGDRPSGPRDVTLSQMGIRSGSLDRTAQIQNVGIDQPRDQLAAQGKQQQQ